MPTPNAVLTERDARVVDALVNSGRYQNASEVLRDDLRLVEEREQQSALKYDPLRDRSCRPPHATDSKFEPGTRIAQDVD